MKEKASFMSYQYESTGICRYFAFLKFLFVYQSISILKCSNAEYGEARREDRPDGRPVGPCL